MLRREHQLGLVDFADFETGQRRNVFVMLPPDFESTVEPDARSPVFHATPHQLLDAVKDVAFSRPRTELVRARDDGGQIVLCQRSAILRYPDFITIEAVPAGEGKAALCIFSRSKYGVRDFGVNAKRIKDWMREVEAKLETD